MNSGENMNRKLIGGVVAAAVAAVAIWFFFLRGKHEDTAKTPEPARTGDIKPTATATPEHVDHDAPAPRGVAPKWALDVDKEGPLQLEGQIVGPDGKPVGGAKVWLGSVPPRTTTAEEDGSFTFEKLSGRTYQLSASSGKLIGSATYKLVDKGDPVVIRLTEGASLAVTVLQDGAKPLEGAEVKTDADHTAKTDAQGKATLAPVNPGWVSVHAQAEGYAPASMFTTVGSSGANGQLTITLHKGYAVSGKVVDEAGKPIAAAKVASKDGMWDFGDNDDDDVTTDDKGQFSFPALAPGSHTLSAIDGEHAPARSTPITVKDRAITGVVITMKTGGRIAGKVVTKDGQPAPFATVRISGKAANQWMVAARQATTDKAGAFELRGLARAKQQARAESDTAASKIIDVDLEANAEVANLEMMLDVSGTIAGIVVDDKGQPVPEVAVNAFPDIMGGANTEGIRLAGMSNTTTDGGGAFTIHGLPDGKYRLWAARASAGFQEWGQQGVAAKTGDKGLKIVLPAPGGLKGSIAIQGSEAAPDSALVAVGTQPATPATKGVFDIKDVMPGTYDVTFRSPEFAEFVKRDVKIEPGKTTDLGKVIVPKGRKLVGKVVDANGAPVAGAKVKVGEMLFSAEGNEEQMEQFEQMGGVRSSVTDQSGDFTIIGIPNKATNVIANHPTTGRSLAMPVPEGTDDPPPLSLSLRGFGSVTGKVTSKGKPVPHVTVTEAAKGGGTAASFAETDDNGNFTLSQVTEGPHIIQAMQSQMMSMKAATATVVVTAGKESKVTIDIPVGTISLTVTVKPLPNNQVDAAQVFVFSGVVAFANGKQLTDGFLQGGAQGMKFWLGGAMPAPQFDELVAGTYSVCVIPITGSMSDPQLMQRIQEHVAILKVYCKTTKVNPTPAAQSFTTEVPAMTPFPTSGN